MLKSGLEIKLEDFWKNGLEIKSKDFLKSGLEIKWLGRKLE